MNICEHQYVTGIVLSSEDTGKQGGPCLYRTHSPTGKTDTQIGKFIPEHHGNTPPTPVAAGGKGASFNQ